MILETHQQGEIRLLQKWYEMTEGVKMPYERASYIVEYAYSSMRAGNYLNNAIKYVVNFNPDYYDDIADRYNL
jgi:hypothetical protein